MSELHAVIEGGLVVNVALAEAGFAAEQGWVSIAGLDPVPGIGWGYDGAAFHAPAPPPPVVPEAISMRQARLALLGAGLLGAVDAAIAALPSPMRDAAQIEWEYATEVRRDSALIAQLGPALGLDDAQVDALFVTAGAM